MALTATIYTFEIALSHVDRGVYETLALRVAQHPSETEEYLLTRVLAYCLEYREGIVFSKGVSDPEEPPIAVRDLTGTITAWIEIGSPNADRLHKASKASPRVAVYTHKPPAQLQRALAGARIHKADALELYAIDRELLTEFTSRLERRMKCALAVTEGHLYLTIGDESISGEVERFSL